jgi:hypothetical protein
MWALVVMSPMSHSQDQEEIYMTNGIPAHIQEVILDFEDLFQAPTALPPSRAFDHVISLLPDIVPINCMPYRYSPQQKTEIERPMTNMLQSGIVIPSLNPFATSILLIKKKDGTWRFYVDYRKLNVATIKNNFPMPIINEFLDEIAGAKYFTKLDLRHGLHQIRMTAQDEFKTTFKTHDGHF